MSATIAGLSTLGILFGYSAETTANTKPTAFTVIDRVNNIGGIDLNTEQIDASALEDEVTKYVRGRQDTGGTWTISFNYTDEVATELSTMISAYNTASQSNLGMWFEVYSPNLADAFYVKAQPPLHIPMPEIGQNELLTIEMDFIIEEYKGTSSAIKPV